MGEEVKKPEETEDEKPKATEEANKDSGVSPQAEESAPPPPPPEDIEMRVFMHCEGCARKVKRSLKGFEGVEDVRTDCRTHKVVVKGKAAVAEPLRVVDRVQKKTGRKVELLTPFPPPKDEENKEEKKRKEEEVKPDVEEANKEEPEVIAVLLRVHMHCEACTQQMKKMILKMKGVQSAEPDLKASQVTVKGVLEPADLVDYIYKRTGKHSVIVKTQPENISGGEKAKGEEEKSKDEETAEGEKNEKETAGDEKERNEAATMAAGGGGRVEQRRNEFYYYYPRHTPVEYAYPPQLFSDENPDACSVM